MDWGALYAQVIAATGWTWEYIAEYLTLPRLEILSRHWQANPPLDQMIRGLLGWQSEPAGPEAYGTLDELLGCWQALGPGATVH